MLRVLGRAVLSAVRCTPRRVETLAPRLMRTPRRRGASTVAAAEETVVVTRTRRTPTPRKGAKANAGADDAADAVTTTVLDQETVVVVELVQTPKGRGKRKAAPKSPAPKSPAKALSRTPSKRIGVLTPEELEARDSVAAEAAAQAQAAAKAAAPEKDAEAAAAPPAKKKRQKKQPWPPGPLYEASMRPPAYGGPATRILSWNVAGLRSLLKKEPGALRDLVLAESASIVCLQETKLQEKHVEDAQEEVGLPDWSHAWNCSTVLKGYSGTAIISRSGWSHAWNCSTVLKGYSGTDIISREAPISVTHGLGHEDHDQEGRVVTAEFPHFFLTNVYTPNSGEGLRRLEYRTERWDVDFTAFVRRLRQRKPVIITGDLNCAHKEIDIHEPKRNLRSAGFTEEERQSFSACYTEAGLVDAFRVQHPDVVGYTYFSYRFGMRAKGKGWRLDYYLVSEELAQRVHDCYHLTHIMGSDHVPIGLVLKDGEAENGGGEAAKLPAEDGK